MSNVTPPDSPTDEIFRTPNSTLDADDSALDTFASPIGEYPIVKMRSMHSLLEQSPMMVYDDTNNGGNMSRMKSLDELRDTPVDLVKLKRDFAKVMMKHRPSNGHSEQDEIDGIIQRRHYSDEERSDGQRDDRRSQENKKPVGNTKYIGVDSIDNANQLMKMKSIGTITDIVNNNNNTRWTKQNGSMRTLLIVPTKLTERFTMPPNDTCFHTPIDDDEAFKVPDMPSIVPLRKEKSSSCIDSMRNRGSSLYDRLR